MCSKSMYIILCFTWPNVSDPLPHYSSAHYHLGSGLAIAWAVYSPTYAATSSYIRGTIRDDPKFLWIGAAVWLVRPSISFPHR